MAIYKLIELMRPPEKPVCPGSQKEWSEFQQKVGIAFPEEYFTVASTYGSGRFLAGEFKIANPFDPNDKDFAVLELARLRETKETDPGEVPFPLYPEAGGLYPFGIDGNGNTFLWKTEASPENWTIACFNSEDYSELVNHSLIQFLVLLASNKLDINRRKFWGSDFPEDGLEFIPRRESNQKRKKGK